MNPVVSDYLAKAREDFSDAQQIFKIGLYKPAARCCYYAVFHAAEGLIYSWTGRVAKTHSGVRAEFARISQSIPDFDRGLTSFLAQAYVFKEISDYSLGDQDSVSPQAVEIAIEKVGHFLQSIEVIIAERDEDL